MHLDYTEDIDIFPIQSEKMIYFLYFNLSQENLAKFERKISQNIFTSCKHTLETICDFVCTIFVTLPCQY